MRTGAKSIAETHSHLVSEWDDDKDISNFSQGSGYRAQWKCSLGHEWEAPVSNRVIGRNCPYCINKRILAGYNDLATTHPCLAKEWDRNNNKKMPEEVTAGSDKRANWICREDARHRWDASILSRKQGAGCPYCSGHRVLVGVDDFATLYPKLLEEWFDKDRSPVGFHPKSSYKVQWRCRNNSLHVWKTSVSNRTKMGSGCPYCSGRRCSPGINDLATTHPHLVKEWNDSRDISTVSYSSMYKVRWVCDLGHEWKMSPNQRIHPQRIVGCPYCSFRKLLVGFNDVMTTHPYLAEEWDDSRSITSFTSINIYRAKWRCKKAQHRYVAPVNRRAKSGTGCPHCWAASKSSTAETELFNYIVSIVPTGTRVISNTRSVIPPKELDIYLPDLDIAFEFNGIYWHSDEVIVNRTGVSAEDYHRGKKQETYTQGVKLFFIWEDDWADRRDLIEHAVSSVITDQHSEPHLLNTFSKV